MQPPLSSVCRLLKVPFQRIAFATGIFLIGVIATSATPTTSPATAPGLVGLHVVPDNTPSKEAIQKKLEANIPDAQLNDARLSDAIDLLRKLGGVDIFVNWKTLEAAEIHRDTPISLHLKNKRFSTVLALVLEIASADREKLGWAIDDRVVTISTSRDLAKDTVTRVYDVRQILFHAPGPALDVRVERVVKLLKDTVAPESWKDRGGEIGSLRELQGQIIVTQTPENQAKLAKLVENLTEVVSPKDAK